MKRSTLVRGVLLVVGLGVVTGGCAGASWKRTRISPAYQAPQQINVDIRTQVSGDLNAAVNLMRAHIAEELNDRKIAVTFTFDRPLPGSAQVGIVEWDPGNRFLRWLFGFGPGEGTIDAFVRAPSRDGQPGLTGDVHGWVRWGVMGGSSAISAAHAGKAIGKLIATGKPN